MQGKINYRGKPVAGATVAFLTPGAPRMAIGTTDEAGAFRLTTFEPDDGAMAGTHVVTVKKFSNDVAMPLPPVPASADGKADSNQIDDAMLQSAKQLEKARQEPPTIPPKYGDRKTSTLRLDVIAGENNFDITLTD